MAVHINYDPSASIYDNLDNPEEYTEMEGSPASKGKGGYNHKDVYHLDDVDLYYSGVYMGGDSVGSYIVMYMDGFGIHFNVFNAKYNYDIYYSTSKKEIPEKYVDWIRAYFDEERAEGEINRLKDVILNREHRPVEPDKSGSGCGGFSVFAGFIALLCAAGAATVIRKK